MRARRTDKIQKSVIRILEKGGFSVFDASRMGGGFPDLVAGFGGYTFLIEVKNGEWWKYTKAQQEFNQTWKGHRATIDTAEQAVDWAINTRKWIEGKRK